MGPSLLGNCFLKNKFHKKNRMNSPEIYGAKSSLFLITASDKLGATRHGIELNLVDYVYPARIVGQKLNKITNWGGLVALKITRVAGNDIDLNI